MSKRVRLCILMMCIMVLSIGCGRLTELIGEQGDSFFVIQFLDVGQGDAAIVCCDGHFMLIDGGDSDAGQKVFNVLQDNKISRLDILVLSHMHKDHIGGLSTALKYVTDISLTLSEDDQFPSYAEELEMRVKSNLTIPKSGDIYRLGSAEIEVLDVGDSDENASIVLLVTYGNTRFLFTGDAPGKTQERIAHERFAEGFPINVLKVSHHGASDSFYITDDPSIYLLRQITPEYAIISVGAGNRYDHPRQETIDRLKQADVKILRTDINGDITVLSDGEKVTIGTSR